MSLRGIDAQIMVNRAANVVPEQSRVQRQPEVAQSQFANMLKEKAEENLSRPTAAPKAENEGIRNEGRGAGGNASGYGGGKRTKPEPEAGEPSPEPTEDGNGSHFDIRI